MRVEEIKGKIVSHVSEICSCLSESCNFLLLKLLSSALRVGYKEKCRKEKQKGERKRKRKERGGRWENGLFAVFRTSLSHYIAKLNSWQSAAAAAAADDDDAADVLL